MIPCDPFHSGSNDHVYWRRTSWVTANAAADVIRTSCTLFILRAFPSVIIHKHVHEPR